MRISSSHSSFTIFTESVAEHMPKHGTRMREFAEAYVATRARLGLPTVPVEDIVNARAVKIVTELMRRLDLLTSRDVAAGVRSTRAICDGTSDGCNSRTLSTQS
ncbi:hypothetical protein GY21_20585 [Cryobacterium roopkundense]|uniref:Uncharacterized protein n=1 Tax=Cryobacterium roopkundense TaxID=1001240 RepID=A0A099J0J3_9MICO|nr:hypothetical protein [Cryobacterium roopkundense]KGJ71675.1 hypothetical protein GY21_20585 [Cryobacterium roopkundense]MBB5641111.1 hypothetical protein [Cryobacterium roopkundense]